MLLTIYTLVSLFLFIFAKSTEIQKYSYFRSVEFALTYAFDTYIYQESDSVATATYVHVLQKKKKQMVGSICTDFAKLKSMAEIGKGAFGKVYLYISTSGDQFAIKKEIKVLTV